MIVEEDGGGMNHDPMNIHTVSYCKYVEAPEADDDIGS